MTQVWFHVPPTTPVRRIAQRDRDVDVDVVLARQQGIAVGAPLLELVTSGMQDVRAVTLIVTTGGGTVVAGGRLVGAGGLLAVAGGGTIVTVARPEPAEVVPPAAPTPDGNDGFGPSPTKVRSRVAPGLPLARAPPDLVAANDTTVAISRTVAAARATARAPLPFGRGPLPGGIPSAAGSGCSTHSSVLVPGPGSVTVCPVFG